MRIAFVVNNYPPKVGGVEAHVSSLARRLRASGVTVRVFTLGEPVGDANEDGIDVRRFAGSAAIGGVLAFPRFGFSRSVQAALVRDGVDLIWTHTRFFPLSWLGARLARRLRVPLVHTEHGSDHVRGVSFPVAFASRLVDVTFGAATLRRADRVVAVSDRVASFVRRLAGVEARVIPNAIDVQPWIAARRPRRRALVFVGRLVAGKGWDTAIEALALVRAQGVDVELDVYGDGPERREAERLVERLGLNSTVRLHGRVEPARLVDELGGALLVNPTVLAEGFQTSLLEVLAAGGAVVTSDVAGARELEQARAPITVVDVDAASVARGIVDALDDSRAFPVGGVEVWGWEGRMTEYRQLLDELFPQSPSGLSA